MRLVRNAGTDRVIDVIGPALRGSRRLDAMTPQLSLFAFAELAEELGGVEGARLLMPLNLLGSGPARIASRSAHS
jgi:hypothetical protein